MKIGIAALYIFASTGLIIFLASWIKLHLEYPETETLIIKIVVVSAFIISGIVTIKKRNGLLKIFREFFHNNKE